MMFVWNFCLFHRVHLISKAQVQLFDKWVWPETYPPESPASTYFNGVSSIANQWRASGSPAKIKQSAAQATVTVTCVVVSTELILIIDWSKLWSESTYRSNYSNVNIIYHNCLTCTCSMWQAFDNTVSREYFGKLNFLGNCHHIACSKTAPCESFDMASESHKGAYFGFHC